MMDCLHSMAPSDEELLRHALDAEPLLAEAEAHLELCSICRQRLARYNDANSFLLSHLYRCQCPDATQLSHYCAGMLPTDDVMSIVSHIEYCPLCATEVVETRRILANFEPFPAPGTSLTVSTAIRRIIATLVPWQPQLAVRSEVVETAWPRQYRADTINISLHLSRASNGETMLLGLLTSTDPEERVDAFEGIDVELYIVNSSYDAHSIQRRGSPPLSTTQVDDLGNLVFKSVPAGRYMMIVYLPNTELVIEGLTILHN